MRRLHPPTISPPPTPLDRRPILQREVEYCEAHPEELRTKSAAAAVDRVRGVALSNVESVSRGMAERGWVGGGGTGRRDGT